MTKPNLVKGGVNFVPHPISGCRRLIRLKSMDQANLVEGGIKLVPVQKAEKVEKYGQNQTWWWVALSLFLFFHQVAKG